MYKKEFFSICIGILNKYKINFVDDRESLEVYDFVYFFKNDLIFGFENLMFNFFGLMFKEKKL